MEICVQTMGGYDTTVAIARWCEENGVPAMAVADHLLTGLDPTSDGFDQLVILGGIVRETDRLELSTLVSPVTYRHPAVLLKAGVTLDSMSGGRFTLGVGTGWMEIEHETFGIDLPPVSERFDRLEEALAYLRAGIGGRGTGFVGHHYRLAAIDPAPKPHRLRLVVGGGGARRTPDLAARYGDEFNVFPSDTPMADRIRRFRETREADAAEGLGGLVSTAFPALLAETPADLDARIAAAAERRKTEPADLVASFERLAIPHGTPERAAEGFAALRDAGVERVYLQLSGADTEAVAAAVTVAREAARL